MDLKETYNWLTYFVYICLNLPMLKDSIECFFYHEEHEEHEGK